MSGALGCVDCKENCAAQIAGYFEPHREKRTYYEKNIGEVDDIISSGVQKAQKVASQTMAEVHDAMDMG